ncbi:hypothetical protein CISIN_1g024346mg [Citrus sinensis]|uniref:Protein YIP n=1 Tax=Citrus sinensis TaxID=2711 RepID=A0A067FSS7_CITSI|nr:hypothetical protein CISIN_1g024346mg [Citrus sinensis]
MDESYNNLPSSHLLGSVPAVVSEEKHATSYEAPEATMQTFPPGNGGGSRPGYQSLGSSSEGFEQQPANNWKGFFSISSYTQYFNVDTDIVINRLFSSLHPLSGDFFSKIDANPDLFVNVAACTVYGYAIVVPLAYYFLLQYMGSSASLVRFWCLWGYSLFIFVVTSFLLLIPIELLRWIIILLAGTTSSCFVAFNLKSYMEGNDLTVLVVASFCLQMALAIFIKVWFFP